MKVIASEWNRNLFECKGGKNGAFIPDAISDNNDELVAPLFSSSDIDKYPILINEPDGDVSTTDVKEEQLRQKQVFNNMINALDGVATEGGRIIVMSTNHIEKFSETFLRPGRIDLLMEIPPVNEEVFRDYVYNMYHVNIPEKIKLADEHLTIGKLQFDVIFRKLPIEEFLKKYTK